VALPSDRHSETSLCAIICREANNAVMWLNSESETEAQPNLQQSQFLVLTWSSSWSHEELTPETVHHILCK
jgi:hypothetical protein